MILTIDLRPEVKAALSAQAENRAQWPRLHRDPIHWKCACKCSPWS